MNYSILDCLRVRPFSSLLAAELFTQLGTNIFNFYLILVVFSITKSNAAVAAIVLSFTIPAILFGIPAGVYVDRWEKKHVLLVSNLLRAALLVLLAFFHDNIYALFFLSFLISTMAQFFIPAESPMIPLVVPPKLLLHANALFGLVLFGSMLLAFILSGPTIIYFGQVKTPLLLAAIFALSCFFIWLITVAKKSTKRQKVAMLSRAMIDEVKDVLKLLSRTQEIHHALFLLALSQVLILIIFSLAPGYATQVLGVPLEDFPLRFIAPATLGVFVGAIIVSTLHRVSKNTLITSGIFLSGFAMIMLPYGSKLASRDIVQVLNTYIPTFLEVTIYHIVALLAFLLGFANALVFVPSNTILQENTVDQMRGKVYGVLNALVGVFSLIPLLLTGWLSDLFGVTTVIVGIGVALLSLGVLRGMLRF